MSRLELFKSLMISKDELLNPALFHETGIPYRNDSGDWGCHYKESVSWANKKRRIFVIFYDQKKDTYWYIKSRDVPADPSSYHFKLKKGEILIEDSRGLLKNSLYVDSSAIFIIDADLLESLVDKNLDENNENYVLNKDQQELILNKMNGFFNQKTPYLSIVKIYKMGIKLSGLVMYLCPEKWEYWDKKFGEQNWENTEWRILFQAELDSECDHEYFKTFVLRTKFQRKYFPNEYKENFERDKNNAWYHYVHDDDYYDYD